MSNESIHADTLNALYEMQRSPTYALRRNVLADAERIIAKQEREIVELQRHVKDLEADQEDVCGFCGQPGADKIPHPVRWPGEQSPGTEYVHAECEQAECGRAHAALTDEQRMQFLSSL